MQGKDLSALARGGLPARVRGARRERGPKALPAPRAEKTRERRGEGGNSERKALLMRGPDQRVALPRIE